MTSTCRCWAPITSAAGPGRPTWVHTGTRLARCGAGPLPIAEPIGPAPAVQAVLFDLPPAGWTPVLLAERRSIA